MRFFLKYKKYSKIKSFTETFPKDRLLHFKFTKWKGIKSLLLRKLKKRVFFKNNFNIFLQSKRVKNYKKYFNESLILKRGIFLFYGNSLPYKYFRALLNKSSDSHKKWSLRCFFHPLFCLDILLWKVGLFKTTFSAKQSILVGKVLINNKTVSLGYRVKKGDIISFSSFNFLSKIKNSLKVCSYLEIDAYTNKVIVLKDFFMLGLQDLLIIFKELVDLQKLAFYLNKAGS